MAFALGGGVNGGQVHGTWPGLTPGALDGGALAVTTDLRDVFAEMLERRLGLQDAGVAFPGHVRTQVGLFA